MRSFQKKLLSLDGRRWSASYVYDGQVTGIGKVKAYLLEEGVASHFEAGSPQAGLVYSMLMNI